MFTQYAKMLISICALARIAYFQIKYTLIVYILIISSIVFFYEYYGMDSLTPMNLQFVLYISIDRRIVQVRLSVPLILIYNMMCFKMKYCIHITFDNFQAINKIINFIHSC